jgi:hypothetical protein
VEGHAELNPKDKSDVCSCLKRSHFIIHQKMGTLTWLSTCVVVGLM